MKTQALSGELFAGTGMLGRAVGEVFGTRPAWFCEFDAAPSKVLAHHYPDVPNYGDVTKVNFTAVPHTHVRAGGFPCQDVSVSGARAGLRDGTRSGLWSEFARSIAEDRPDWVVIENVGGLLSAEAHSDVEPCPWCLGDEPSEPALRALGAVLADLAALGFDAEWTSIRASDIGAPHGRLRVFILAWPAERTIAVDATGVAGGRGAHTRAAGGRGGLAAADADDRARDGERSRSGSGDGGSEAGLTLLPTPTAGDHDRGHSSSRAGGDMLTDVVLLPTPTVVMNDGESIESWSARMAGGGMSGRPKFGTVYAVYWPREGVLKVGIMWRESRIRDLIATGAEVLAMMRDSPAGWERYALRELAKSWPRAFPDGQAGADASEIILRRGRGFTECYRVPVDELPEAVDAILRGTVLHDIDQAKNDSARGVRDGADASTDGPGDRRGIADARRRPRPRPRRAAADPRRRVAGDVRGDRVGPGRSPAHAGGGRADRAVRGCRGPRVLRLHLVGAGGPAGGIDGAGAAAVREALARIAARPSREPRGGGEGGRGGARGRECGSGWAGGSQPPPVPRSAPPGSVLPRSPGRHARAVHRLPERPPPQQTVPGSQTAVHAAGGHRRRDPVVKPCA